MRTCLSEFREHNYLALLRKAKICSEEYVKKIKNDVKKKVVRYVTWPTFSSVGDAMYGITALTKDTDAAHLEHLIFLKHYALYFQTCLAA